MICHYDVQAILVTLRISMDAKLEESEGDKNEI